MIYGYHRGEEWIFDQNRRNKSGSLAGYDMKAFLFTTGPYLDMAISSTGTMVVKVEKDENGEDFLAWRVALTADGGIPHIALDDCGYYVKWLMKTPGEADRLDLEVSIEHVHYADLVKAFEKVTGHKARFVDVDWATYWKEGPLSGFKDLAVGAHAGLDDPSTITIQRNFTDGWNIWRASGYNKGVIRRDYEQLDRIFPGRIRTAEEFLRRQDEQLREKGSSLREKIIKNEPILKGHADLKL